MRRLPVDLCSGDILFKETVRRALKTDRRPRLSGVAPRSSWAGSSQLLNMEKASACLPHSTFEGQFLGALSRTILRAFVELVAEKDLRMQRNAGGAEDAP